MDDMDAFEQQLARDALRDAGPSRSFDAAAVFGRAVPRPAPRRGFGLVFGATRLAAAGVIVAVFAGVLLLGLLGMRTDEQQAPAVELPAEIPPEIESGTLDTPFGPARWVHLIGDAETLPGALRPIPVPGGYVSLDEERQRYGSCASSGPCQRLWFSPDLLEWTQRPLPADVAATELSIQQAGGEYWLVGNGSGRAVESSAAHTLWRSADALDWHGVDIGDLESPWPDEVASEVWLGSVAASGDTVLVVATHRARPGRSLLGLPPSGPGQSFDMVQLERLDDGTYLVSVFVEHGQASWSEEVLGQVRFLETEGSLRVIDAKTDDVLNDIQGLDMDSIERWASGSGSALSRHRFVRIHDERVTPIDQPEPILGAHSHVLSGDDDGFTWLQPSSDGLMEVWASPDGLDWAVVDAYGDDPDEPPDAGRHPFYLGPDGFEVESDASAWWVSSGGVAWQAVPSPNADFRALLGPGWVVNAGTELVFHAHAASEPAAVDAHDLQLKTDSLGPGGAGTVRLSSNTIAHFVAEAGGPIDLWIITFDDLEP